MRLMRHTTMTRTAYDPDDEVAAFHAAADQDAAAAAEARARQIAADQAAKESAIARRGAAR